MLGSVDGVRRHRSRCIYRKSWLRHAERHLSPAANGKNLVFQTVLQFSNATFDLFSSGLCDPR